MAGHRPDTRPSSTAVAGLRLHCAVAVVRRPGGRLGGAVGRVHDLAIAAMGHLRPLHAPTAQLSGEVRVRLVGDAEMAAAHARSRTFPARRMC